MIALLIAASIVWAIFSPKTFAVALLCTGILWGVACYPILTVGVIFFIGYLKNKKDKNQ